MKCRQSTRAVVVYKSYRLDHTSQIFIYEINKIRILPFRLYRSCRRGGVNSLMSHLHKVYRSDSIKCVPRLFAIKSARRIEYVQLFVVAPPPIGCLTNKWSSNFRYSPIAMRTLCERNTCAICARRNDYKVWERMRMRATILH